MKVLNFDKRDCEKARRRLDAYLSNELLVETADEVLAHLEKCADCTADLESRTRVRDAVRLAVAQREAPAELRARIHRQLRSSHPETAPWLARKEWLIAAAAVVLVILGVSAAKRWLGLRRDRALVAAALNLGVQDHVHCALIGKNYPPVPPTPAQMRTTLGPRYAGLLPVVMQKLPGYQILDAHICHLPGSSRHYVHFITRKDSTILSVIFTRKDDASLAGNADLTAETVKGVSLYETRLESMDVAGFDAGNYLGFVVSDLGQRPVLTIAASLAPDVRDILQKES